MTMTNPKNLLLRLQGSNINMNWISRKRILQGIYWINLWEIIWTHYYFYCTMSTDLNSIHSDRSNWTVDIKLINPLWSNLKLERSKLVLYALAQLIWCPYWLEDRHFCSSSSSLFVFLFLVTYTLYQMEKNTPNIKRIHEITSSQNGWFSFFL